MANDHEGVRYHGRRSVDELAGALNAGTTKAALAHYELSRLHLDRFIAMMANTSRHAVDGVGKSPTVIVAPSD